MQTAHARKHVVVKRVAGTKGKWKFHRSFMTQTEGRRVAKAMKAEGMWETKCVLRKSLESYA